MLFILDEFLIWDFDKAPVQRKLKFLGRLERRCGADLPDNALEQLQEIERTLLASRKKKFLGWLPRYLFVQAICDQLPGIPRSLSVDDLEVLTLDYWSPSIPSVLTGAAGVLKTLSSRGDQIQLWSWTEGCEDYLRIHGIAQYVSSVHFNPGLSCRSLRMTWEEGQLPPGRVALVSDEELVAPMAARLSGLETVRIGELPDHPSELARFDHWLESLSDVPLVIY